MSLLGARLSALYLLLLILVCANVNGQDKIYSTSGVIPCNIVNITPTVVSYLPLKSSKSIDIYVEKILLVFNSKGLYLRPSKMDFNLLQSKELIDKFLHGTANPASTQIFKIDNAVIDDDVLKEDKNFLYLAKDNNKIDKKQVSAVIYKDGHHTVYGATNKAADVLWSFYESNLKSKNTASKDSKPTTPVSVATSKSQAAANGITNPANNATTKVEAPQIKIPKQEVVPQQQQQAVAPIEKPAPAPPAAKPVITDFLSLPDKAEFEKKAEDKTDQFTNYLKIILDRTMSKMDAQKATQQALLLFVNDSATVEVSSLNKNPVRQLIGPYLDNLRLLRYDKIVVKWTRVQYVTQLKKNMNGDYTGTVTFEQEFAGYRDGKLVYSDVTIKKALVILRAYDKFVDGVSEKRWDVLLGDIGVESTRSATSTL